MVNNSWILLKMKKGWIIILVAVSVMAVLTILHYANDFCVKKERSLLADKFLADNRDLDIEEWLGWTIKQVEGRSCYLANVENSVTGKKDSVVYGLPDSIIIHSTSIVFWPKNDSMMFKVQNRDTAYVLSSKRLAQDTIWQRTFNGLAAEEMEQKALFVEKYKIDRICGSQEDTTLHIIFWGYKHDPGDILLKSNNTDFRLGTYECDWQYLGEGWYIRRAGWNDRNGLPHHFAQEKP